MHILKTIKRNPISTAFVVGIIGCFANSSGNIQQNMESINQVRDIAQHNAANEMKLRASQQSAVAQAEIANSRYQSGCVMVVAMKEPKSYTSLSEGQPVLDRVRKTPLPVGTIVCDANGNTGKIVSVDGQPVVGEMAFTGNKNLVASARKRSNAHYVLPNQ
jgi:hypothetical protein